jgi:hypothetical protein
MRANLGDLPVRQCDRRRAERLKQRGPIPRQILEHWPVRRWNAEQFTDHRHRRRERETLQEIKGAIKPIAHFVGDRDNRRAERRTRPGVNPADCSRRIRVCSGGLSISMLPNIFQRGVLCQSGCPETVSKRPGNFIGRWPFNTAVHWA